MKVTIVDNMDSEKKSEFREEYYGIQNSVRSKKIQIDDILYLKKEKKYTIFHCIDGNRYKERTAISKIHQQLPQDRFVFVDKDCVANLKYASALESYVLKLNRDSTCITLSVSRRKNPEVKESLAQYWRLREDKD